MRTPGSRSCWHWTTFSNCCVGSLSWVGQARQECQPAAGMGAATVQLLSLSAQDLEPTFAPRNPAVLETPKAILYHYYLSWNHFKIYSITLYYFPSKLCSWLNLPLFLHAVRYCIKLLAGKISFCMSSVLNMSILFSSVLWQSKNKNCNTISLHIPQWSLI